MMGVESAQSTKETGQQPAAPDGPHTSPLTHTLALTLALTHTLARVYIHLRTPHIHPCTYTYTLAHCE